MSDNWKNDRAEMEIRKHDKIMMKKAMQESLQKKIDEFNSLENDVDCWKWIIANKDLGFTVFLDNDDTFISLDKEKFDFIPENKRTLELSGYIGRDHGVFDLLQAIGVNASGV